MNLRSLLFSDDGETITPCLAFRAPINFIFSFSRLFIFRIRRSGFALFNFIHRLTCDGCDRTFMCVQDARIVYGEVFGWSITFK